MYIYIYICTSHLGGTKLLYNQHHLSLSLSLSLSMYLSIDLSIY